MLGRREFLVASAGGGISGAVSLNPFVSPDRIEPVARALCLARGIDPDAPYRMPSEYRDRAKPPEWARRLEKERAPAWRGVEQEAIEFLTMLAAAHPYAPGPTA